MTAAPPKCRRSWCSLPTVPPALLCQSCLAALMDSPLAREGAQRKLAQAKKWSRRRG